MLDFVLVGVATAGIQFATNAAPGGLFACFQSLMFHSNPSRPGFVPRATGSKTPFA